MSVHIYKLSATCDKIDGKDWLMQTVETAKLKLKINVRDQILKYFILE
jgi:hypothetical protein